jgi:hypothetical protein
VRGWAAKRAAAPTVNANAKKSANDLYFMNQKSLLSRFAAYDAIIVQKVSKKF